ncbi:MAG: helix-turn-helix domain-containing protein [Mobiluncus porci]|uniref:helix-turn-helix domain-containing protein n=1 Tax=Mobiluncus porci TaxID=2652278 RepID=UPI0023F246B4|nr:helix-turn-helix domain-containing protein [Mobiluncus porci]MDD7541321.1 helix-turn-helix domain-containing protein [Mobiluncus porci]MDY5747804.1 helix-turn-helix domain-containing protein [Mobiluncus porci]
MAASKDTDSAAPTAKPSRSTKAARDEIPAPVESPPAADAGIDLATLGARIRHARTTRGMTLTQLGEKVNRATSLLSQIENGKREPRLNLLNAIATALGVTVEGLMKPTPPTQRAALELELSSRQDSPTALKLGIPTVHIGPRLPTDALKSLVATHRKLQQLVEIGHDSPEAARKANQLLHIEMHNLDNYLPEIESLATEVTEATGFTGGPLVQSGVEEIANYLGFSIVKLPDLPRGARSITDLKHHRIYLSSSEVRGRDQRNIVLRALGDQALNHPKPTSYYEFLRQRVEANYFASAVLMPQSSTVKQLQEDKKRKDISVLDLADRVAVSYETAVHRFTNLATKHLGISVHFLRVGTDGTIYKAYANDGVVFPTHTDGSIEGQLACRKFGARQVFEQLDPAAPYYQYTDTPTGTYWSVSKQEPYRAGDFSISLGVPFEQAQFFRGRDTNLRLSSNCPDPNCCREPSSELAAKWARYAWPSVKVHSHMLAATPPGTFPGVDDREVYEFLENHSAD